MIYIDEIMDIRHTLFMLYINEIMDIRHNSMYDLYQWDYGH